jgi:Icc-related predicted phosphoesterase
MLVGSRAEVRLTGGRCGHQAHVDGLIRIAGAGDVHASEDVRERIEAAFAALDGQADLVLLAGDLTVTGQPEQARVLADACSTLEAPVFAVLGNHDWHANRTHEVVATLADAGIRMLERSSARCTVDGRTIGIVGLKGFVGGFPDYTLPDFGEPLLRQVYAETTADVEALDRELEAIADCDVRVVLLHYSPTPTTLEGEPRGIWPFLGSDRLAAPIAAHCPDVVLHGHAHNGTFEGFVGAVPVYNVAVPVMRRDFWLFDLGGEREPEVEGRVLEPRAG